MRFLLIFFTVCLVFVPSVLFAQNHQMNPFVPEAEAEIDCDKLIEQAELSFKKRRRGSEALIGSERQLTRVLKDCPNLSLQSKVKERLDIVREERAEQLFVISAYYLEKFRIGQAMNGQASIDQAGGCYRLNEISDRYPDYSKIDQVISLLKGDVCSEFFLPDKSVSIATLFETQMDSQFLLLFSKYQFI